ncbi:MAG: HD-GYP domain-containing protein (c-di-GMP phosphodiesterase class II) [Halieaceae bacterium]|jgi:HD-GYP domain-containing protein (c-di-GMP phosphodiesterase class II)
MVRLVKVEVADLRPGMFVSELDRPWLETPFMMQGFVVRDAEDIAEISKHVEFVYVDCEHPGWGKLFSLNADPRDSVERRMLVIKEGFLEAKISFESAAESLEKVFGSLRGNAETDINVVQKSVQPLIRDVFRNHEAVSALLRLRESGDYRYNHGISMALWAVILGRHLGLQENQLEKLAVGCAVCDVGMTKLPAELLNESGSLSEDLRKTLKEHPRLGLEMVANCRTVDQEILGIIEYHHERMDGSGYPHGLEGDAIPQFARIAGIVDAYDAMVTPRIHAGPRTSHEAAQELIKRKGTEFDGALVEAFIQVLGLFPTGVLVELNTGEVGIVIKQNPSLRLKPEVMIVLDADKKPNDILEFVDFTNQDTTSSGERWISGELLDGSYDVNARDFFI